ncbi:MAG: class I SAM-dependent methyltransferase [Romboutsia sp.]
MTKAKYLTKVTDINKLYLEQIINEGDIVVDATMGNGYDTKYLALKVGKNGFVYSFDIQEAAIKSTHKKLVKESLEDRVKLILDGHENMDKYIEGKVSCVLFNLGYLPRSEHMIITKPNTTIKAIEHSLQILKPNGVISIAIYTGHPGGMEEKNRVYEFVKLLDQNEFNVLESGFINQINNPPKLVLIEKKRQY